VTLLREDASGEQERSERNGRSQLRHQTDHEQDSVAMLQEEFGHALESMRAAGERFPW